MKIPWVCTETEYLQNLRSSAPRYSARVGWRSFDHVGDLAVPIGFEPFVVAAVGGPEIFHGYHERQGREGRDPALAPWLTEQHCDRVLTLRWNREPFSSGFSPAHFTKTLLEKSVGVRVRRVCSHCNPFLVSGSGQRITTLSVALIASSFLAAAADTALAAVVFTSLWLGLANARSLLLPLQRSEVYITFAFLLSYSVFSLRTDTK